MGTKNRFNLNISFLIISALLILSILMVFSPSVSYADGNLSDYLLEDVDGLSVSIVDSVPTISVDKNINKTIKIKDSVGTIALNLNGYSITGLESLSAIQFVEGGSSENTNITINGKGNLNGGNSTSNIGGDGISSLSSKCISITLNDLTINAGKSSTNKAGSGIVGNFKVIGNVLSIFGGNSSTGNGGDGINVLDDVSLYGGSISSGNGKISGIAIKSLKNVKTEYVNVASSSGLNGNGGNAIEANSADIFEGRIKGGSSIGGNGNGGIGIKVDTTIKGRLTEIYGGDGNGSGNGGIAIYAGTTMQLMNVKAYGGNGGLLGNGGNGLYAEGHIEDVAGTVVGGSGIIGGIAIYSNETLYVDGGSATGGNSDEGNDGANALETIGDIEIKTINITGGTGGQNANGGMAVKTNGDVTVEGFNDDTCLITGGTGGAQGNGGTAISCNNATISKIIIQGGAGGDGNSSSNEDNGGNGGDGGVAIASNSTILDTAIINGGQGGNGGKSVSGNGGNGGNGAEAIVTSSSSTINSEVKGGNGGNGGNTDGSGVFGGNGGLAAEGGQDGKKGLNKAEQLEEYIQIFRGVVQLAQSDNYTDKTNKLIDDTYVELQKWLVNHSLTLQENIDLVDEYVSGQYQLIFESIKENEIVKANDLKNKTTVGATTIVEDAISTINLIATTDEETYVLFSDYYKACEETIVNAYKTILRTKSEAFKTDVYEISILINNGLLLISENPYDETKSLDENIADLDQIFDAIRKYYLASVYVSNAILNHINSGVYIGEGMEKLNSIYNEFKVEVQGIDPIANLEDIETFKQYYLNKLDGVTIYRVKVGDIDLSKISKNDTYYGKYNGSFWGYVENANGLNFNTSISINLINRTDVNKAIKELVKGNLIKSGKDSNLSSDLTAYVKNKDVKAVVNVDLYENNVKVEKVAWNEGIYKVVILLPEDMIDLNGLQVASIEDGSLVLYNTIKNGNYLEFYTTHFSEYIILGNKIVDLTWLIVVLSLIILVELILIVLAIYNKIKYTKYVNYKNITFSVAPIAIMGVTLIPMSAITVCIILAVDAILLLIGLLLIKYNIINIYNIVQNSKLSKYKEEEFSYEVWVVEKKQIEENNDEDGEIIIKKEKRGQKSKKNKIKIIN